VRELKARRATIGIAEPRRGAEVVAETAIHLQTSREGCRQPVLEILERVVRVGAVAVRRVVLRVAIVSEVEAELVAVLVVETDPRELVLELGVEGVRVARKAGVAAE